MFKIYQNTVIGLCRILTNPKRCYASSLEALEIRYRENGDPNKVLEHYTRTLLPLRQNEVAVRMLAAPINPADINMIQGVYPIRPEVPAIGGNEGIAEVSEVGVDVSSLKIGDWVVPGYSGWGTWRTVASCPETDLMKVPKDISAISIATMSVNPCTAYRMLRDFVDLKPGDVVIQNGANSAVGQCAIQIAKELGLVTVNIVRNRPDVDKLDLMLKSYGADHVITDEFVRTKEMKSFMKSLPKPKLALNCVGGRPAAELLKYLAKKGTMVTYGGMSKQPLMVPAGPLIFSDAILRGFWVTAWNKDHRGDAEHVKMWDELCDMVRNKKLKLPRCKTVDFDNFKQAVSKSMEEHSTCKQILVMDKSLHMQNE